MEAAGQVTQTRTGTPSWHGLRRGTPGIPSSELAVPTGGHTDRRGRNCRRLPAVLSWGPRDGPVWTLLAPSRERGPALPSCLAVSNLALGRRRGWSPFVSRSPPSGPLALHSSHPPQQTQPRAHGNHTDSRQQGSVPGARSLRLHPRPSMARWPDPRSPQGLDSRVPAQGCRPEGQCLVMWHATPGDAVALAVLCSTLLRGPSCPPPGPPGGMEPTHLSEPQFPHLGAEKASLQGTLSPTGPGSST